MLKDVQKFDENGNLCVSIAGGNAEKVHSSGIITAGTTAQSITVNANITTIQVANYSNTANITLTVGTDTITVGPNLAEDIPINAEITNISIAATEADTKVYYLIRQEG